MMYLCVCICWLLLLNVHVASSEDICPSPVAENIGTVHNTRERFDRLRESVGNTLTVKHIHHEHKDEKYEYFLSFCGPKNSVSIKQVNENDGSVKNISRHDSASVLIGADDWLFLQYKNGEPYGTHCKKQKRQGWLSIRCEDRGEKPKLRVIEEARFKEASDATKADKLCYYLFEYNHPAACSPKPKKPMNGGAVFCIIVIVVFSAYLIFGFLYQRFVLRASGLEQIPNYSFWRKFGNRMADGCDFVCRTEESNTNLYKGITDDLDMDSSDEDRDEGLLPM